MCFTILYNQDLQELFMTPSYYVFTCVCMCIYIYIQFCVNNSVYSIYMYIYIYIHIYTYIYIYIYIYAFIYRYKPSVHRRKHVEGGVGGIEANPDRSDSFSAVGANTFCALSYNPKPQIGMLRPVF